MSKKVAILISGSGSNMVRLVEDMTGDHPARPVLVLCNKPEAAGLEKARALGVPTAVVDHRPFMGDRAAFEAAVLHELDKVAPDIICLAGFMRILSAEFITHYQGAMLNTHPSLLPKYKGLNTHARVLEAGDPEHGCSVHLVTPELDGGPVLGQARLTVAADETPESLNARVLKLEHALYPAVLRRVASGNQTLLEMR